MGLFQVCAKVDDRVMVEETFLRAPEQQLLSAIFPNTNETKIYREKLSRPDDIGTQFLVIFSNNEVESPENLSIRIELKRQGERLHLFQVEVSIAGGICKLVNPSGWSFICQQVHVGHSQTVIVVNGMEEWGEESKEVQYQLYLTSLTPLISLTRS